MSYRFLLPAALGLLLAGPAAAQSFSADPAVLPGLGAAPLSGYVSAGTVFAGRYGAASYLSPALSYQLTPRFRVFAGGTYLRTFPGALPARDDKGSLPLAYQGFNRYFIQGGGTYAISPRLSLTGSAWKDLTPMTTTGYRVNPYAGFGQQGLNLRADYHVTENFSVSGGLRMTQGGYPGYGAPGLGVGF
ncbi:hypothetical protein EJV47_14785 [Hymenobacter gummosus]|uniref:Outer membrane protein beta-barrel domain-containing protein n=1 Tax=Hymenobacter gummosus TaxID=1776032 RepID=A0A3S0J978_9BACT|nr:hypothetical protein [Hymenobacter gummosus]RTQ48860.1 hypothetical protein EJV47_14785 [Hymenobacter gummosus]